MTIRELRDLSGKTQHDFADFLEIPFRSIQNWEGGQRNAPEYVVKLIEYKLIKEGIIMTYAELKAKGVKIQESDRYDGGIYLGTNEYYILNGSIYLHEYNSNLSQYTGKENNTEFLTDMKESYSDDYYFAMGINEDGAKQIEGYIKQKDN